MSISGNIAMGLLRLIKPGKGSFRGMEEQKERARKENEAFVFSLPKSRKAEYHVMEETEYPCLCIRPHVIRAENKAVLYIYGGVTNNWNTQKSMAVRYAVDSKTEVWYPVYPSMTERPIPETVEYLYNIYKRMLERYEPKKIAWSGVSMGGYYALEMINWMNRRHPECPMPGVVFAHSAGGFPVDDKDWEELRKYEKSDPMFSEGDIRIVTKILADAEHIPGWIMVPGQGDFHNAPETYLYYGEEMLAGNAPAYKRAYERDGSGERIHIEIVKNMMHGYSCMPVFPESKKSYRETLEIVKKL